MDPRLREDDTVPETARRANHLRNSVSQRAAYAHSTAQNRLRQKTNFTSTFNPITLVQPSA
jgi:hypothetical protein